MAKATTIKEAIKKWDANEDHDKADVSKEVLLFGQNPPIEKMDASLSVLTCCEKLSLSTNCIDKISNLNTFQNLKILSLGRNKITSLKGVEAVGNTLEQLWISYNLIDKLKGVESLQKLKVLYMSNNLVKDWAEFGRLVDLPCLEDLNFIGNPLQKKYSTKGNWIEEASKRLPKLKKLDGTPIVKESEEEGVKNQQ